MSACQQHELIKQAVSFCFVHFAASTIAQAWVNVIDKADSMAVHVPAMWSKPGNVREPDLSTTKFETSPIHLSLESRGTSLTRYAITATTLQLYDSTSKRLPR